MEPEFRLWLLIVPALINTAGLLMYGIGAYRGLHWIISAGVGTGFIGFGIGAGGAIGLTYAIDCYPGIAAESMVLILFIRNVLGLLFTLAIQYAFQLSLLNYLTFISQALDRCDGWSKYDYYHGNDMSRFDDVFLVHCEVGEAI